MRALSLVIGFKQKKAAFFVIKKMVTRNRFADDILQEMNPYFVPFYPKPPPGGAKIAPNKFGK